MAKGGRWSDGGQRGGTRDAGRRNDAGHHPRTRQEGSAPGGRLSTTLQPGPVPAGLRPDLPERRCDDPGCDRGDRGRDVPGEDRGASSSCCDTSATDGPPCGARTSRRRNGKMRPLGIPTWSDKLLQEVMRSILEAYYEPQFSDRSHGFRPERGCHTALRDIYRTWTGTKWFIEGDIKGCFDNIDHAVLLSILREKIRDNRFLTWLRTCSRPDTSNNGTTGPPSAGRRRAGSSARCSRTSTSTGWTSSSNRRSSRSTPGASRSEGEPGVRPAVIGSRRLEARGGPRQTSRPRPRKSSGASRRTTRSTRTTAGCGTSGTPTTSCSASIGPRDEAEEIKDRLGDVPARSPQAGTLAREDLDHPRPDREGPVPRLRHRNVRQPRPTTATGTSRCESRPR